MHGASKTDQPNSRLRVRTVGGALAVSIGLWTPAEAYAAGGGNSPAFAAAIIYGHAEAIWLARNGYEVRKGRWTRTMFASALRRASARISPRMRDALYAHFVLGVPICAAARAATTAPVQYYDTPRAEVSATALRSGWTDDEAYGHADTVARLVPPPASNFRRQLQRAVRRWEAWCHDDGAPIG